MNSTAPVIVWEECACLLCGSTRYAPLLEAADRLGSLRFLVVRCERCQLCFTNPRPDVDSIRQFYPADYRCHLSKERVTDRTERFAKLLKPRGQKRLLDFGCGGGDFLERMRTFGWHVVGLDASDAAVAHVRRRGLDARVGTLPHPDWSNESFEAIVMRQALEHVHQPLDALRAAHRLLAPGGTLIATVPNFDSLASRRFGSAWFGLDLPRHLTHFTSTSLRLMFEQAGFEHIDIQQEQHHSWIRHSAEHSRGAAARFLRTRLGAGFAGTWGRLCGQPEAILAIASK